MSALTGGREETTEGAVYRLRVESELGGEWSAWFDDLAISAANGITTMTGRLIDQAALYSLLIRIRDLGLLLLSVERVEDNGEAGIMKPAS